MKSKKLSLIILFGSAFFNGCYPKEPDTVQDLNIIITKHDPTFDYKSLRTYALPDSVIKFTSTAEEGDSIEFIGSIYSDAILSSIRQNMDAYGLWTGVTYNRINNRIGSYDIEISTWHFASAFEAGIWVDYDAGVSGYFSARYNNNFKTDDLENQSYPSLNIGLMYR
jgi:hypothetical protein